MSQTRFHFLPIVLLALAAINRPGFGAEWGSIRGNNRDHAERGGRVQTGGERRPEERRVERGGEHRSTVISRPEEHIEPRREVVREPERGRDWGEFRHFDTDIDRHHGYYWSGYHAGMFSPVLPPGYVTFSLGNQPYYYYEGVYYQPGPSGYVVVAPPVGVVLPALPPGVETVVANNTVFYYAGGAFYVQQPNGYAVVPPPLGITVTTLPPGAVPVNINGNLYYTANSVYYMPVMQGGMTVYMTVRP